MAVCPAKANHMPGWKFQKSQHVKEVAVRERCKKCNKKIGGANHDCKNGK